MYFTQLENYRKCLISSISTFGLVSILFTEMGLHRTRWFPPKLRLIWILFSHTLK